MLVSFATALVAMWIPDDISFCITHLASCPSTLLVIREFFQSDTSANIAESVWHLHPAAMRNHR